MTIGWMMMMSFPMMRILRSMNCRRRKSRCFSTPSCLRCMMSCFLSMILTSIRYLSFSLKEPCRNRGCCMMSLSRTWMEPSRRNCFCWFRRSLMSCFSGRLKAW